MRWMKLEPIIQSDVSQKDKDQYSILTHIYGIQKDGNNNPICKTENSFVPAKQSTFAGTSTLFSIVAVLVYNPPTV